MAQVKLLKIAADGVPLEHTASADDLTMLTFTVNGGGPVLSGTGLDMNGQDISDLSDLVFTDPAVGTVNQTAGALIINNIMAKERGNTMTTAADILFPVITDIAGQVDGFRVPALAGVPTATPTVSGAGYLVYDSSDASLYVWTGSVWDNLNTVSIASNLDDEYTVDADVAARDVVYISAADSVSPAIASAAGSSQAVGLAVTSEVATDPVQVRKYGRMSGFSSLTPGARYYLSGSSAGAITATVPTGSGHTIVQVGYAKNATDLDIQFQSLGRRA